MLIKRSFLYYVICLVVFVILVFVTGVTSARTILGSFAAFFMGAHVVHGYVNKEKIYFGWATVENSDNSIERFLYFLAALASIALAIIALIYKWA